MLLLTVPLFDQLPRTTKQPPLPSFSPLYTKTLHADTATFLTEYIYATDFNREAAPPHCGLPLRHYMQI